MKQQLSLGLVGKPLPVPLSCDSIEWYTPAKYVEAARQVMGCIDCDPASNAIAQQVVQAGVYYTKETNGYDKPWPGNVWLNPPYGKEGNRSNQGRWSQRLIEQYQAGITGQAVLLVNVAPETSWFQILMDYPVCFPAGRINFYTPSGKNSGSTHASALVYLGPNVDRFYQVFHPFGRIVRTVNIPAPTGLWQPSVSSPVEADDESLLRYLAGQEDFLLEETA